MKEALLMLKRFTLAMLILFITLPLGGCGVGPAYQKTGFYLYNIFDITIHPGKKISADDADRTLNKALDSLRNLDSQINPLNPISDINSINDLAAKRPVKVNPQVFSMLEKGLTGAELTESIFDITLEPLLRIFENNPEPSEAQVKSALSRADYTKVLLDGAYQTVRFTDPAIKISFNLMRKGFAIDLIASTLEKSGVYTGLIRSGFTGYALGKKKAWLLVIPNPDNPEKKLAKFYLKNKGFCFLSSTQDNFFKGTPSWLLTLRASKNLEDRTIPLYTGVIAPNAVTAEVLAYSLYVLGPVKGLELVRKLKYDGFYLTRNEAGGLKLFATNGLKKKFKGVTLN